VSSDGQQRVRPFMKLTLAMLPGNLNATFRTQWLPIFKLLEEKLATQSTETFEDDEDEIEQKYMRGLAHLKERVSYCWNKNKLDPAQFTLGTWSNKTSRSAILKHGNVTDKEKLSEPSNRNKVRPNKTRNKKKAERPLYPSRQRRRIEKQQGRTERDNQQQQGRTQHDNQSDKNDDGGDAFADAFGGAFKDVTMTPHQARRDKEFKEQIDKEIEDGQRAAAAHRQVAGDGVATDGSLLFVRHSTGLRLNYGDNSNIGRKQYADVLDSASAGKKPAARKKTPPMAKKPPPITTLTSCAIKGCTFGTVIQASHKCYNKCGRLFHNLCAQVNDLCDDDNELDMYCSIECKRSKK
jgi:murein DD-endopeptidase MepM/ murein hydrolase activator NlpD